MRVAAKKTIQTSNFKPLPFLLKKDKKNGLVILTPINWSQLSEEEIRTQYVYCKNILWEMEKEGQISRDVLFDKFITLITKLEYKKEEVYKLRKLKEWEIPFSLLSTSYLIYNGLRYKPATKYFGLKIKELLSKEDIKEEKVITVSKDKRITTEIIGEIQDLEDRMFSEKIDFNQWVQNKNLTYDIAQAVRKFFIPRLREVSDIIDGKDEQLNEAYRKLSLKQKAYMARWYISLSTALNSVKQKERKQIVRKSRSKTPEQIVKNLKYMSEFKELSLVSVHPKKILASTKLWVYNTKLRKLIYFTSNTNFTIRGTTIESYTDSESFSKTIRKPEIQLKEFLSYGKKQMLEYFKSIKSKEQPVNGRISKDCVLLATY